MKRYNPFESLLGWFQKFARKVRGVYTDDRRSLYGTIRGKGIRGGMDGK